MKTYFTCAAGLLLSATMATSASATFWQRQSPANCMAALPSALPYYTGNPPGSGQLQNNNSYAVTVICPAQNDWNLGGTEVSTFNVDVYDASNTQQFQAKACVTYADATGGECGLPASSPVSNSPEHVQLQPDRSSWTDNAYQFNYVWISMPAASGSNVSAVNGMYYAGTQEADRPKNREQQSSACHRAAPAFAADLVVNSDGSLHNSSGTYVELVCPIPDDSGLGKKQLSSVNLKLRDSGLQLNEASVCIENYNNLGYGCGNTAEVITAGGQSVPLDLSTLLASGVTSFGYVDIFLGASSDLLGVEYNY